MSVGGRGAFWVVFGGSRFGGLMCRCVWNVGPAVFARKYRFMDGVSPVPECINRFFWGIQILIDVADYELDRDKMPDDWDVSCCCCGNEALSIFISASMDTWQARRDSVRNPDVTRCTVCANVGMRAHRNINLGYIGTFRLGRNKQSAHPIVSSCCFPPSVVMHYLCSVISANNCCPNMVCDVSVIGEILGIN